MTRPSEMRGPACQSGGKMLWAMALMVLMLYASAAQAEVLEAPPGAPLWQQLGAKALLFLHIGGGTLGMLSGPAALLSRKGDALHRRAGKIFF